MVLLDTNIFIIDRFFKRDKNYGVNKEFLSLCSHLDAYISIFPLFELCGIASFNLSVNELDRWLYHFDDVYTVNVLEVKKEPEILFNEWFEEFSKQTIDRIKNQQQQEVLNIFREVKINNEIFCSEKRN